MTRRLTRRAIMKGVVIGAGIAPVFGLIDRPASAEALPPLDPKDPTAAALGFVTDASKVSAAAFPTYKPGQRCGACAQFQGKPTDATGGCNIFVGHSVPQGGWCKVWAQRPAG
jgi:hypothetical protein